MHEAYTAVWLVWTALPIASLGFRSPQGFSPLGRLSERITDQTIIPEAMDDRAIRDSGIFDRARIRALPHRVACSDAAEGIGSVIEPGIRGDDHPCYLTGDRLLLKSVDPKDGGVIVGVNRAAPRVGCVAIRKD